MSFQRISCADAEQIMAQQVQCHIVDIRDAMSFRAGHIRHAQLLDNDNVGEFITNTDKQTPVLVCCYHGNASQGAADYLAGQGFTTVYSIDGGYQMWASLYPDQCEAGE